MQNRFGLLDTAVLPMFMIMPRYSHNYALFYQLLDSNLFTHRTTYAILREATSETYGPRVYLLSYKFPIYFICNLYFPIYIIKIPKIFGIIRFMPLVVSHSFVLPLIPKSHRFCPNHFAPLMLLPFDHLTVSLKTS